MPRGSRSTIVVRQAIEGASMGVLADIGGESFRQKMITVIVLGDRFSGALAYALQSVLHEPAKIRVVRVAQPEERDQDLGIPLPVDTVTLEAANALVRECASHDVIVVEPRDQLATSTDRRVLELLRCHAPCLVVEVDDEGQVVGASGPEGWSYSANDTAPERRILAVAGRASGWDEQGHSGWPMTMVVGVRSHEVGRCLMRSQEPGAQHVGEVAQRAQQQISRESDSGVG